jgi:hypothetical protein
MGQKRCYFKKRTGEVIENKGSAQKTNRNEPKNEAGKLLKIRTCGKNEPENEAADVVENKGWRKKRTGNEPEKLNLDVAGPKPFPSPANRKTSHPATLKA